MIYSVLRCLVGCINLARLGIPGLSFKAFVFDMIGSVCHYHDFKLVTGNTPAQTRSTHRKKSVLDCMVGKLLILWRRKLSKVNISRESMSYFRITSKAYLGIKAILLGQNGVSSRSYVLVSGVLHSFYRVPILSSHMQVQ